EAAMSVFQAVRNHPSNRLLLLLLLLPLLVGAAAPAAQPSFEGTSQVVAVEVPINAVGRDGEPIRGLTAADFEIYDGNELQKITSFEVIDLKLRQGALGTAAAPAPQPADELTPSARRHFLFLFDLS